MAKESLSKLEAAMRDHRIHKCRASDSSSLAELEQRLAAESDPVRRMDMIDQSLRPPEPQLLDTCVIQNLDWIDRQLESRGFVSWDEDAIAALAREYGDELAQDLIDLGILYKYFEHTSGYPWLVCEVAFNEISLLKGPRSARITEMVQFLADHQSNWSPDTYPQVPAGALLEKGQSRVSPLILRALGVKTVNELQRANGPLSFLPDAGDRAVATYALLSNVPMILTTDRKSFWAHRSHLLALGVQVIRPSELLASYEPYWTFIESEFARRRS